MAFPENSIVDDFNRANESPATGWTHLYNQLNVVSNQAAGTGADYNFSLWNATAYGPDCEAFMTIATKPAEGDAIAVHARVNDTSSLGALDGYSVGFVVLSGTDEVYIQRITNGVVNTLGAAISQEIAVGDQLGIQVIGDTITAWHHDGSSWTNLGSRTDATYTEAGLIGLTIEGTTARLDTFGGGSLASSGGGGGETGVLPQDWRDSAEDIQIQFTADGRVQVGDATLMATDDALIEAHRDELDTGKPTRGLHLLGEISGTLSAIVAWAVQELVLKGSGGIEALHSALRVRLTNENTGTMTSGADLRAADIEVINNGGGSSNDVPVMTGLRIGVTNQAAGYADTAYGLKIEVNDSGSLDTLYALHADAGLVHVPAAVEVPVLGSDPSETPPSGFVLLYIKLDGGVPRWYAKDASSTVHAL